MYVLFFVCKAVSTYKWVNWATSRFANKPFFTSAVNALANTLKPVRGNATILNWHSFLKFFGKGCPVKPVPLQLEADPTLSGHPAGAGTNSSQMLNSCYGVGYWKEILNNHNFSVKAEKHLLQWDNLHISTWELKICCSAPTPVLQSKPSTNQLYYKTDPSGGGSPGPNKRMHQKLPFLASLRF